MEKKLKKVQRGAAVGFVLLKIMRILLIIAAIVLIAALVFLAVVNENDLLQDVVQDGKLAGAVTHVFLETPEEGYGIMAQNMVSNYQG